MATVVLITAAGCKVDQKKEVALYRSVLDANRLPPPPTTQLTAEQTLTLEGAMALANRHNEQLGLSGEDYVQALINKNRAVANFLPTVAFQPSYTIQDKPGGRVTSPTSNGLVVRGDTLQGASAPVVGNINLFRGFGDVANLRANEQIVAQRRELLLDLQATILLNVAQTYYQVLRSERSVEVLSDSLKVQEARLRDVERQFKNGLATRLAVSQTQAQVASTRVLLVQAESDVRNGRSTLALVIGVPRVEGPLADTFGVPADPGDEARFEATAIGYRQDLRAAQRGLRAAEYNVKVAVSQYYPSVDLNVQGFLYRENFADAMKWSSILTANLPIFSAGLIEADVRTAWSRLRQAALDESAVRRQALNDVQVAYENMATSEKRIRELRAEVTAADEAFRQSQQAFQNGLGINLDVLTAQNQLLDAQLRLTGALFDRTVFYLDLIRSTGQLVETMGNVVAATQPTTRAAAVVSAQQ
jgi:outer membrane protein